MTEMVVCVYIILYPFDFHRPEMDTLECGISKIVQTHNITYASQVQNASCSMSGTIKAQEQQRFIGYFINENMPDNRGIVLWHGLGSGKTLTSINASLQNNRPVVVIAPASLIGNFRKELDKMPAQDQGPSVGHKRNRSINYDSPEDNVITDIPKSNYSPASVVESIVQGGDHAHSQPHNTSQKTRKRIIRPQLKPRRTTAIKRPITKGIWTYRFYSSNGDLNASGAGKYAQIFAKNSLIIIDESQLLISKIANSYRVGRSTYGNPGPFVALYNSFMVNAQRLNLKIICLSGTPIINNPLELAVLFNMLKGASIFNLDTFALDHGTHTTEQQPYSYSYTTESNQDRAQNFKTMLSNTTINNAGAFITKIAGLVSYFGNISRLLPRVQMLDPTQFKYGINNEGEPLFSIKECVMSDDQYRKIERIQFLTKRNTEDAIAGQGQDTTFKGEGSTNQYLIGMKVISYDFSVTMDDGGKYNLPTAKQEGLFPDATKTQARRTAITDFYNTHLRTYKAMVEPAENNLIPSNDEMRKHSIKIYEICAHIERNKDKKHIIYCESKRVNVILARALRKYMNYRELIGTKQEPMNASTFYYLFLTGKGSDDANVNNPVTIENSAIDGIDVQTKETKQNITFTEGQFRGNDVQKEAMIDLFNSEPLPSQLNVIILNSAAAEGITLKKVNFVHLLQVPANMSRLYQIIGRSIRNCTHSMLAPDDQYVTPILYLATHPSIPEKDNSDIIKYESIVRANDKNIPYLYLLKQAAIDCELNRQIPGNEGLSCYIKPGNCRRTMRRVRRRIGDMRHTQPQPSIKRISQRNNSRSGGAVDDLYHLS